MQERDVKSVLQAMQAARMLQGRWTIPVLWVMRDGPIRLSELRRLLPKASKKGITNSLRSLVTRGVVLRRDLSSSVLRVEYELHAEWREPLLTLLNYLTEWAAAYEGTRQSTQGKANTKLLVPESSERPSSKLPNSAHRKTQAYDRSK